MNGGIFLFILRPYVMHVLEQCVSIYVKCEIFSLAFLGLVCSALGCPSLAKRQATGEHCVSCNVVVLNINADSRDTGSLS